MTPDREGMLTKEAIALLRPHERNERRANQAMHELCNMAEAHRASVEGGGELVKRLDALYAATTQGEWSLDHGDHFVAGPVTGNDWVWIVHQQPELDEHEHHQGNCRFITAIHNAWPQIRASLATGVVVPRGDETIIGRHSGKSTNREWWNGGVWLHPGDEIVERTDSPSEKEGTG